MHRWTQSAAGGMSQRLKPGAAIVRSRLRNETAILVFLLPASWRSTCSASGLTMSRYIPPRSRHTIAQADASKSSQRLSRTRQPIFVLEAILISACSQNLTGGAVGRVCATQMTGVRGTHIDRSMHLTTTAGHVTTAVVLPPGRGCPCRVDLAV